jgi:exodeoxyribonuclease X
MSAVILDTETTGFDEPQPVEIAYQFFTCEPSTSPFIAAGHFCQRYKPSKPITLGGLATHHILDEELKDCPPYTEFILPHGVEYLIGHNVDFDWEAIGKPDVKRIDTCCLARKLWPAADSHGLGALLYLVERRAATQLLIGAHSAQHDAYLLVVVLKHMLPLLGNPQTWEELWQLSEAARIPDVMPFGMHKGKRIADVPADYKRWLLGQPDVDQYLRKALTS